MCERRHFKCKVQCRARWRARENLKYRSNLRLYPVNFGNKLCILIFIILSIWPNFFDPPPFTKENFLVPPSGNSKLFRPPSILPSPPTKVFMNAPLNDFQLITDFPSQFCVFTVKSPSVSLLKDRFLKIILLKRVKTCRLFWVKTMGSNNS